LATDTTGWNLDNTYARLPEPFLAKATPVAVRGPKAVVLNLALADELGLNLRDLPAERAAAVFAGQELPPGAEPIAQAYAGHQYGGFTMLGDGRAILLGEQLAPDGRRFDVQLKGPGPTPFSRRGDGRAALGPMLREYIISEAMHALGIPTTRSLAVVTTGEPVYRERVQPGAVLTRVAASHIRVGTFQYMAARRDEPNLKLLADYTIARHYPDLSDSSDKYLSVYRAVMDRQAALVARWQLVGFVHGVLNTDNVAISGETIDYGPCAFLDAYDPDTVFSSIDSGGRYAYGNQPGITQWNLARFAETLLPLLAPDQQKAVEVATAELDRFPELFEHHWNAGMRAKLGLRTERPDDSDLFGALLKWMRGAKADFTNTFADLSTDEDLTADLYAQDGFRSWRANWETRLAAEGTSADEARARMRAANPVVVPRNHRVEEALAAAEAGDLAVMERLVRVLQHPFERTGEAGAYREPSPAGCGYRTFCGT
jgi:serine/tyrosine/threonine adenylyltransferase